MLASRRPAVVVVLVLLIVVGAFGALWFATSRTGRGAAEALASLLPPTLRPEPVGAEVLVGAGDIADCDSDRDEATARLVASTDGTVFTTGDNAYPNGTADDFRECYGPSWGAFLERTRPSLGNHEYYTGEAAAYFEYFGERAGDAGQGWYAYDLREWRVYALNSNCDRIGGCEPASPQVTWLEADLRAHPRDCVVAYWHHPRFSSSSRGDNERVDALWRTLVEARAELVIVGHDHLYERFARLDADGRPVTGEPNGETVPGTRQIIAGTGGRFLHGFGAVRAGSEARDPSTFGVLELVLRDDSYEWRFHPVEGSTFTDEGFDRCR